MKHRVFIPSGAGSPGFGGIAECLREDANLELYSGDINPNAYGKNLSDGFAVMPAGDSMEYIGALMHQSIAFGCNVILPITTRELYQLSEHKEALWTAGLHLAISPVEAIKIANNKARLYEFLVKNNKPCCAFKAVHSKTELLEAIAELNYNDASVVLKPAEGNGSRGLRIVMPMADIQNNYFNTKAGSAHTTIEALKQEIPNVFPQEMVVCEYLPGDEYSIDMLVDNGHTLLSVVRLREKTVSGISVKGTFVLDKEITDFCENLAAVLNLHGPIGMQMKRNHVGSPRMLEINPRLQGAVSTARYVGYNFPLLAVKLALAETIEIANNMLFNNVSFSRFWKDIKD